MVGRAPSAGGLLRQGDAGAIDFGETGLEVRVRNAGEVVQVTEIRAVEPLYPGSKITRHAEVDEQERPARTPAGDLAERDSVEQSALHGRAAHNHIMGVSLT